MTLDTAIKHLEETLADPKHDWSCEECRQEHRQLLMWLKDYKCLRDLRANMTFIEEAVKQGKDSVWVGVRVDDHHYHYVCKNCNRESKYRKSVFCPNCGRVMLNANFEYET